MRFVCDTIEQGHPFPIAIDFKILRFLDVFNLGLALIIIRCNILEQGLSITKGLLQTKNQTVVLTI